jgi:phosphoenolpyruvate carboxykinase (ATP)
MLAERIREHNTACWLVNTGWVGGSYGVGSRISLKHTRAIIDAIHSGALSSSAFPPPEVDSESASSKPQWTQCRTFNLYIPTAVPGVPSSILDPSRAWIDEDAFDRERVRLASLFRRAFKMFENDIDESVKNAGPILWERKDEAHVHIVPQFFIQDVLVDFKFVYSIQYVI